MRAAFVKSGGGVELREVPEPSLEKGSIIVEMKASGVCGTDLEKLTGRNIASSILGHEVSGIVVESDVDVFQKGARVVPHHHVSCCKCDYCKSGAETSCEGFRKSNFSPCGFADRFLVPRYNVENGGVHLFGQRLSFEEASIAEPLACCIRGIRHVLGKAGESQAKLNRVLIVGAGPIGLLHMELVRSSYPDATLVATDIISQRLEFAAKFEDAIVVDSSKIEGGAFSGKALSMVEEKAFDLVIVATGAPPAFGEALKCVRRSGTILLFGAPHKGATYSLDLASLFLNELTITTSYATNELELAEALRMIEDSKVNVRKFITGRFALSDISQAMEVARTADQVKVVVVN